MEASNGQYSVDFQTFNLSELSNMIQGKGNSMQDTIQFIDNLVKPKKSRKRKATTANFPSKQTPLQLLNELIPGCIFNLLSADGPPHCPNFVVSVEVNGKIYTASANNKQVAKQKAASAVIHCVFPEKITHISIIPDDKVNEKPIKSKKVIKLEYLTKKAVCGEANPVMALNEIFPGLKYECIVNEGPQNLMAPFTCQFQVGDAIYHGSGASKKNAKAAAARSYFLATSYAEPEFIDESLNNDKLNTLFANKFYDLVTSKYQSVAKEIPQYAKRQVLSAIIMTTTPDLSDGQVLNVSTGTKCICGEYLSCQGTSVNDCHAEIISRRALVSFFYHHLKLNCDPNTKNDSIFILKENGKGFMLKPGIQFHLYVSTSCCGDARIFSPHENIDPFDKHPNRQSRGQLRTKIESGEGTIPVKSSNIIQTWDGIMMGQKLLTMSCSDKVAKWNVVGVQGSLLSHFLDPIYLTSITLGSLFNPLHTKRALYGRIEETLAPLPEPFKLNTILMSTVTSLEPRLTGKAPNYSLNWLSHEPLPEIIDASTGKTIKGEISRLCKMSFFSKFKELINLQLPQCTELNQQFSDVYFNAKESSTNYMRAKHLVFQAFAAANLGNWIKKPMEQDYFEYIEKLFSRLRRVG